MLYTSLIGDQRNVIIDRRNLISDQRNVAELIGDYFPTMANEIDGQHVIQLDREDFNKHVSLEAISHSYHSLHFQFNKIDSRVVENELKKLNTHKATGWNAISNKILKPMAVSLAPSLTKLFNTCIQSGQWPSNWKRGVWTPVFKQILEVNIDRSPSNLMGS